MMSKKMMKERENVKNTDPEQYKELNNQVRIKG